MKYTQLLLETKSKRNRSNSGFSLIELMVVIAIIAMLAGAVSVAVFDVLEDSGVAVAKSEISTFKTALMAYRLKFKKLPSTSEGLDALVNNEKQNFLDVSEVPLDPWSNPYIYTLEGSKDYTIVSLGADGAPGGDGSDADISSKNLND